MRAAVIHTFGPFPMRQRILVALVLVCAMLNARASRQDDSLSIHVDGLSSSAERARALLVIAGTQAKGQPGESLVKIATAIAFTPSRSARCTCITRGARRTRG